MTTALRAPLAPLAKVPVFGAALASGVLLSAFSAGYGYERDELYFRMLHPAWGYVDQPPLTPMLARGIGAAVSDATWAIRIPATLAAMVATVVVALIAREVGGGRGAQALAAWGFAFAALPMIFGHVLFTATIDLPVWPAVVLFVMRVATREEPRWWVAVGALVGLSTYNKLLVTVLLIALAVGLLAVGPRRILVSRWLVIGAAVAVVLAIPNLIYQATHHWPQLSVGRALADHNGGDVRVQMWWFLFVMLGPPLVPVWIAGLVALWRDRRLRFVAVAFPVLLVLVFVMGSQFYYPIGLLSVLFAVGCVPTWRWVSTRTGWRRLLVAGVVLNAAVSCVLALPLVPVTALRDTPIASISQVVQDSVGWPRYVDQIASAYRQVPAGERAHTAVLATNYGEAGAIDRYGPSRGLPEAYSGQNQLTYEGRPPEATTTLVVVGGQYDDVRKLFRSCRVVTRLDNGVDVDNEEQDEPVGICRGPMLPWSVLWPKLHHLD